jgi:bacterioferritin-associated ferredoxin
MIVCSCRAVSDHAIREAVRAGQCREEILASTGVGSDCGACMDDVDSLLGTPDGSCRPQPCAGCPRRAPAV